MINKLVKFPTPLAKALKKGAHRKETSQHQLVIDAVARYLDEMGDGAISALVDSHYAEEAERTAARNPEPTTESEEA